MVIAATVLMLALAHPGTGRAPATESPLAPAAACVTPERTGTFRVVTALANGTDERPGLFVLENIAGCLEVMYITDEAVPAIVDSLSLSGDTLKGALHTSKGAAKVTLQFTASGVAGSITQGRREWRIAGRRTS